MTRTFIFPQIIRVCSNKEKGKQKKIQSKSAVQVSSGPPGVVPSVSNMGNASSSPCITALVAGPPGAPGELDTATLWLVLTGEANGSGAAEEEEDWETEEIKAYKYSG